jgi:hypothetical protein
LQVFFHSLSLKEAPYNSVDLFKELSQVYIRFSRAHPQLGDQSIDFVDDQQRFEMFDPSLP